MSLSKPQTRVRLSLVDVLLFLGLVACLYGLIGVAREWVGPFRPKTEIDLSYSTLVRYSFLSLVRVVVAYFISLGLTLVYGYVAAKSRFAEPVLISLLDILQSVPVLGFMPGLVLALVYTFPHSNLGLELAAVLMIVTGQAWNMVFSYYSSLKSVPRQFRDMGKLLGLTPFSVWRTVELPFAASGLLWNSMVSMAGGWFFLMVIESFTLGENDFRLPGIGSYMAVAYEAQNTGAIVCGMAAMVFLIILVDRCVWAPLVAWSHRFNYGEGQEAGFSDSLVLDWLQRSDLIAYYLDFQEGIKTRFSLRRDRALKRGKARRFFKRRSFRAPLLALQWVGALAGVVVCLFGVKALYHLVGSTSLAVWLEHGRLTFFTFLRVMTAVFLGCLWTIPVGVFIGTHPKWTRRLQPLVQVVASFPAPMLFPMLTGLFLSLGMSLEFGAVILMVFASQWYILFNVISGATLIPRSMLDMAAVFQVRGFHYWKSIILPAIFPSLLSGLITATGGAWNACIVAEWVAVSTGTVSATGIGASITRAASAGDFPSLAAGVLTMVTTVVLLNRFFWERLYRLAETRFRMDGVTR